MVHYLPRCSTITTRSTITTTTNLRTWSISISSSSSVCSRCTASGERTLLWLGLGLGLGSGVRRAHAPRQKRKLRRGQAGAKAFFFRHGRAPPAELPSVQPRPGGDQHGEADGGGGEQPAEGEREQRGPAYR